MLSNDSIMNQEYYELTGEIVNLSIEIGKLLGIVDSTFLRKPDTKLRKENQVKTIHSSLAIEGNTLSKEQVTAIIENRRVLGPQKDILEVKNAIQTYNGLKDLKYDQKKSYLKAHKLLMSGLVDGAGKFRTSSVGIFKGSKPTHIAPPAWNVENLMNELFKYIKTSKDSLIIKSCVFHYEMEFIHPFLDGNGRMGRLWQTVILLKENPVFEYLPIEHAIRMDQKEYYKVLELSDKSGKCTLFVEFMFKVIMSSLDELVMSQNKIVTAEDRIRFFFENQRSKEFVRKDYLSIFKNISTATASRDLKKGIAMKLWTKKGEDRLTKYVLKSGH